MMDNRMNLKKCIHFTNDEDKKIKYLFEVGEIKEWDNIAEYLPNRSGKSCRDRYMNHLKQNFETENWLKEEEDILLNLVAKKGRNWLKISKHIPGKTPDSIKKRFRQILSSQNGKENFQSKRNKGRIAHLVLPPNVEEDQLSNIKFDMKFVDLSDEIISNKFLKNLKMM
jgi:hypothetical protein